MRKEKLESFAKCLILLSMLILGLIMINFGLRQPVEINLELPSRDKFTSEESEKKEAHPYPYIEDINETLKNLKLEV